MLGRALENGTTTPDFAILFNPPVVRQERRETKATRRGKRHVQKENATNPLEIISSRKEHISVTGLPGTQRGRIPIFQYNIKILWRMATDGYRNE